MREPLGGLECGSVGVISAIRVEMNSSVYMINTHDWHE